MDLNKRRKRRSMNINGLSFGDPNSDVSDNDQKDSCSENKGNIRDDLASGVIFMLNLIKNMIPIEPNNSELSETSRRHSTTFNANQKRKQKSTTREFKRYKKNKCNHNWPGIDTDIENTSSDSENQIRIQKKYLSKREVRSDRQFRNKSSDVVINNSVKRTSFPRTAIKSKLAVKMQHGENKVTKLCKNAGEYTSLRRSPKRSKTAYPFPMKENEKTCNCRNEAENSKYSKKVKEILDVIMQPNTKQKKIQYIQILKKNKRLLSCFLVEKRKLGKRRIPILTQRNDIKMSATTGHFGHRKSIANIEVNTADNEPAFVIQNESSLKWSGSCLPNTKRQSIHNKKIEIKHPLSRISKYRDHGFNNSMQSRSDIGVDACSIDNSSQPDVNRKFSVVEIKDHINHYENISDHRKDMTVEDSDNTSYNIFRYNTDDPLKYSEFTYVDFLADIQSKDSTYLGEPQQVLPTEISNSANESSNVLNLNQSNQIKDMYTTENMQTIGTEDKAQNLLEPAIRQHFRCLARGTDFPDHTTTFKPRLSDVVNTNVEADDLPTMPVTTSTSYCTMTQN